MNLGNQPVEILIEDVYLLVVPSPQDNVDPEEEERRAQASKQERLENAELFHMHGQAEVTSSMLHPGLISIVSQIFNLARYFLPAAGFLGFSDRQNNQQCASDSQEYTRKIRG